MYTGRPLTADQALDFGLVERVSAPDQLLTDSMAMAREIAGNSPIAVRHIKHCVDEGLDLPLERSAGPRARLLGGSHSLPGLPGRGAGLAGKAPARLSGPRSAPVTIAL